jgi:hypothetical protein
LRKILDTAEKEMEFRSGWEAGTSVPNLARQFGMSERGVNRAAERMGLPKREHYNFRVRGDEMRAAFARDWAIGTTLAELAALYGFKNLNSVSRYARRQGLPKRKGGPRDDALSPGVLRRGRWVQRGGIKVWQEDSAA